MNKLRHLLSVILAIGLVLANVSSVFAMPPLPSSFYGTVKVNGANVAAGTQVTAWINGVQYATTTVQFYNGDSVYSLNVAGDDSATPGVIEGGVAGDTVVFHIGALTANETAPWTSGTNVERNLTASVNAPPVITESDPQAVAMSEDGAPAPFSLTLHATDANGDTLTWSISTPAGHGTAAASGAGPSKAIGYTPQANYYGSDSFIVQVSDGSGTDTLTVNVTIASVNDAPNANPQPVTTPEDTPKAITLTGSDLEASPLTYAIVNDPTHGALTGTPPSVTYTPAANYNGPDSFTFRVNDGTDDSSPATVSITVTAVNDAPTANPQSVTTPEDTPKAITLTGSDPESSTLSYAIVTGPTHGDLSGTAPDLTYTPDANFSGSDSFTFRVNDGATNSSPATVSITVTGDNDAPTANPQSVTTPEDTAKAITLTGSDPEGSTLTYAIVTGPSHGALTGTAPNVTYTPAAGYNGPDSFTFKVNDGTTDSPPATVSITVTSVNDAPTANPQSVTTPEDTAKAITLTGSDPEGSGLTYTVVSGPSHGALSGTAPNLTYTPAANYYGSDSFTFKVNDGGLDSSPATVNLTITAVNDAPTANAQSVTTPENTAKAVTLSGSDPEGSALTFSIVTGPTHGELSGTAPTITYTPDTGYNGPDTFTFKVNDGALDSPAAGVSVTVTAVNDAPTANPQSVTTPEDTAKAITLTGSDPDGNPLTFTVVSGPSHGALTGSAPNLTYTPAANYNGPDSFTFKVNDGSLDSPAATVSITISAVNDAPTANAQSVITPEDAARAITLTGSDPEGSPLTYSIVNGPAHGSITGTAPNVTYTPAANYAGGDSFTFKVSDGSLDSPAATVTITVTAANDAPTADPQSVTTAEDTAKSITLTGSDVEGSALTYTIVTGPAHGSLSGTLPNQVYTPAANFSGPDSFTFKVNDGTTDSNIATVSITVTAVNDIPTANPQSVTTLEDTPKAITLSGSDVEGSALTYAIVSGPSHGSLTGTLPSVTYTPAANYAGSDSFTFKVNDGTADSAAATVNITITAVNDAPVANAQSVTTPEDTAKAITLTGSDAEGSPLTFSIVAGPAHGSLSGTLPNQVYTPAANYSGTDSFTFKVNDGAGDSNIAVVDITITAVNDAPVANPNSWSVTQDTPKAITLTGFDVEGSPLIFTVLTQPAHGTLSGTAPNLTYTPAADYYGQDSFTFKVNDGTVDSAPATITLNVEDLNYAPVADPQSVTTAEDTSKAITLTGSDHEGSPLTFAILTSPAHGWLSGTAPNVTYNPNSNYNGPDEFTFKVNDGSSDSNIAKISITVTAVNDAPVANEQAVTTVENTAKAITLNGSDVEGSPLTFAIVTQPSHGALSGTAPNMTYTPTAGYAGADSFTFKVNDGSLDSAAATVSITVTGINDAPTANPQSVTTAEDTAKAITLTGSDPEGSALTYIVLANPAHGALSGTAPNLTYTPAANYAGSDSFTFKVNDGAADSNTATVSITVTAVNDVPTATPQSVTTAEDTAKAITLSGSDVEGSALTYTLLANPAHGSLSGALPNLTYTPDDDYAGADSFTFKVNDGTIDSAAATVAITVTPANDAPSLDALGDQEVDELSLLAFTASAQDVDGDDLAFSLVNAPAGAAINPATGAFTWTPSEAQGPQAYTFSVKVCDEDAVCDSDTLTVTVGEVNVAPVLGAIGDKTAYVGITLTFTATVTDADLPANTLTFSLVGAPSGAAINPATGVFTWTPSEAQGPQTYTFTVRVSDGAATDTEEITVVVGEVDTPPVAQGQSVSTDEDVALHGLLVATDIDGDTLAFAQVTAPAHGTLSLNTATGAFTYTPAVNYHGPDSFTFKANDGFVDGNVATVSITVKPVNDAPVLDAIGNKTVKRVSTLTFALSAVDADGDALIFSIAAGSPPGAQMNPTSGVFAWTPSASQALGPYEVTFSVTDGPASDTETITITVTEANHAPVAAADAYTTQQDTPLMIPAGAGVLANDSDADGDPLTAVLVDPSTTGALTLKADGSFTYTPTAGYTGTVTFTYRAADGQANSPVTTVTITVTQKPVTGVGDIFIPFIYTGYNQP